MNRHAPPAGSPAPRLKPPEGDTADRHESAWLHVSGRAEYIDDLPEPEGCLHACLGLSERAHARIAALDLAAVLAAPGVAGVLTARDVPCVNDISPTHRHDEPVFAEDRVLFHGQPIFAVVAATRAQARAAARLARADYEALPHAVDIEAAEAMGLPLVTPPLTLSQGDAAAGLAAAPRRLSGEMRIGGQDHFYLEGHIALAIPQDDGIVIHSSTQHPSEVQHMVAAALGLPANAVTVLVRRMGGAFGGKETQSNLFAVVAALAALRWGRAVKLRPDRDDDMISTGKRHDFRVRYEVGFDDDGRILAVDAGFAARCGFSSDLSGPVTDRALFHADNAYFYPAARLVSQPQMTHTVSNTAFRGFGGPQGVVGAERIIEEIAYATGRDPLEVRKLNFYGEGRDVTPYHQRVEDNILPRLVAELEASSDYGARRAAVLAFNRDSRIVRRGIALTPVKFGISFTATWYNQAGALVHVYQDGSVQANHGGTEMGQGLHTKVRGVVAEVFGLSPERVRVTATATDKVPNTSATAASSGADLNGMAALAAATTIRDRLRAFLAESRGVGAESVRFEGGMVLAGDVAEPFAQVVKAAYMARVQLSASGYYRTPKVHWDREKGRGRPFYYYAYGAAASEVSVDTLTGEHVVDRVDILHDAGKSLNPEIDLGQVEGGFVQGMGWLTSEELWWDEAGRLRTHAPSTYKIPLASDRPRVFNVALADWSECREMTIKRSKAVGEPPLMLAASVLEALSMAVASLADYRECPRLDAPATPERLLMAAERLRGR
ncbi:xanthine dehydrogenase molybdopterin binding subunit [Rubrimonas cliftonensis]|uniref:Xanthine dehydrogenase, molybdenum binding subunit apoprotein n=1 Tax=Rubrimonas cliftonensis TaxID=89524 RepID=A0A1H3YUW0_9RHOB|nr:xanthine dehydrogenase molybdopterin binding subunit [Rubrimonas cliftonensis]SEA15266.1 xanthine dehydrogenase, molybdenum binding subunit apoprotein [Rubrimonas cliftonensis]